MTRIDDKILLRRYHEDGDLQAREKLIEQYMSLVRSLARRYSYRGEQLEDLQLALDAILDRTDPDAGDITVRMSLRDHALETMIGPLGPKVLDEIERETDAGLGLRRVLESTVEDVHVDGEWVRLTKKVAARG